MIIKNQVKNIISYELAFKLNKKNVLQIPKMQKITLNIGFNESKKIILSGLILIELISKKKAIFTRSQKDNSHLKIRKNTIIGVKSTLRSNKLFKFLENIVVLFFSKEKNNEMQILTGKNFNFIFKNFSIFSELNKKINFSKKIKSISVAINFSNNDKITHKEIFIFLNGIQFPIMLRK